MAVYAVALVGRTSGRLLSAEFRRFVSARSDFQRQPTEENYIILRRYDFDFQAWPIEFVQDDVLENRIMLPGNQMEESTIKIWSNL